MLKENHLAWAGGVRQAVAAVQASAPWPSRVIVEAETGPARPRRRWGRGPMGCCWMSSAPRALSVPLVNRLLRRLAAGRVRVDP